MTIQTLIIIVGGLIVMDLVLTMAIYRKTDDEIGELQRRIYNLERRVDP